MTALTPPALLLVSIPMPHTTATDVQHRLESAFKGRAVFIPEDPFGVPERRIDMGGVLYPSGQDFALEITSSWIRVWVGNMHTPDDDKKAHNRQACERIAAMVAEAVGGTVEEGTA